MNPIFYVVCLAGIASLIHVMVRWTRLTVLQRLVGLQFFFIVLHMNEELRWPGGFVDMLEDKLHFTLTNPHFGELVLSIVVLVMFVPPLLFPRRAFLAMVPMVLGVVEFVVHTAGIWLFDRSPPYTPGLASATFLLMPVGVCGIRYAVRHALLRPLDWVFVFLYMLMSVAIGQQIVVRSTGMSYAEFLANIRKAISRP